MKQTLFALAAVLVPLSVSFAADNQPYTGLETREIKALSPERIEGLMTGQGLSYALAAELNGLPGPRHVLDMAETLGLDERQKAEIEAIFARMNRAARDLGAELVAAEARLDETFASGRATAKDVASMTADIAVLEGRLRAVHLAAHLETDPFLSRHQKHLYAAERGYAGKQREGGSHGGHGAGRAH